MMCYFKKNYSINYVFRKAKLGSNSTLFANDNNGSFLQLIETVGKFVPIMAEHVQRIISITNVYLGHKIQNEILLMLSNKIE